MRLLQAIITRPPQTHPANPLRKGPFNARARGIALPKAGRFLRLSTGEQRLLSPLRTDVQHATGRLRAGTIRSARAHRAGCACKDDLDALWITQGRPARTLLPLRARGASGLPVYLEVGGVEAFPCFGLPTVVGQDWTHQLDPMVLLTADQQGGIDIASIHDLLLRQQVRLGQFLLNSRS